MKRKLTTLLSLLLMLLMMVSTGALAAVNLDSALPIVTEPMEVDIGVFPQGAMIMSEFDPETFWNIRYFDDVTGLDINWQVYDPASKGETLSLMMAGGEMPDLLMGAGWDVNQVNDYGVTQGLLYPISTLLEYMPTLSAIMEKQPELRAVLTAPDGQIYAFPGIGDAKYSYPLRFWINKEWLANVGMEMPKTIDDLYNVLKAFKEQDANGNGDPNDEIPFTGSWDEEYPEDRLFKSFFGLADSGNGLAVDYTMDANADDRQIIYVPYANEYKDYLSTMNKFWTEGLFDPDMFTQSQVQCVAKEEDNLTGIWSGANPLSTLTSFENPYETWDALDLVTGPNGEIPAVNYYPLIYNFGNSAISADCDPEKAAALANLMDYYYTPEWYNFNWYGPEYGSEYDYDGIGAYYDENTKGYAFKGTENKDMTRWTFKCTYITFWETPGYHTVGNRFYEAEWAEANPDSVVAQILKGQGGAFMTYEKLLNRAVVPYYREGIPPMFLSEDDIERSQLLLSQLNDYVRNMEVKFITGEASIEADYDNFISTLESYGVQELLEIYNHYYNVYKSNLK